MPYITQEILINFIDIKEVIKLTDDNNDGQIDSSAMQQALESADAEIDLYLKNVYQNIPKPTENKMLQSIAADITMYYLYKRRLATEMPESVAEIYNNAIKKLRQIREGLLSIDIGRIEQSFNIKESANKRIFPKELLDKL
jgi:phage gp36-like protein